MQPAAAPCFVAHGDPPAEGACRTRHAPRNAGDLAGQQPRRLGTVGESDSDTTLGGRLVCSHEYFVKQVDLSSGSMCLGNPWGDAATRKQWECWLTHYEVSQFIREVTVVDPW